MRSHQFPHLLVWFALLSFAAHLRSTVVAADGIITECTDTPTNFSSNSTFYKNRSLLFSKLSTVATTTTSNAAYSTATVGLNTSDPLYGLFMCRDVGKLCQLSLFRGIKMGIGTTRKKKLVFEWTRELCIALEDFGCG